MTLIEKNNNEVLLSQGMLSTRMREKPLMPGELFFNYSWQSLKDNKQGFASSEIWIGTLRPDHPIRVGGNGGLYIKGKYSEFFTVQDLESPYGEYTRTAVLPSEENRTITIGDLFIVDSNIVIFATEDNPRVNGGDVICYIGRGFWWNLSNSTISYNPPTRGSNMANIDYHDGEDIMMSLKSALDILFRSKADLDPYGKIYYDDLPDKIKQQVSGNIHYGNTQVIGDFEVKPSFGSVPLIATNTDPTNPATYETLSLENEVETTELPPNTVRINGDVEVKGVYAPLVLGFENMLFGSSEDEGTQMLIIGTDDVVVNKGDFKIDGSFYADGDVTCTDIACSNINASTSLTVPQILVTGKIDGASIDGSVLVVEGKSSFKNDLSVTTNVSVGSKISIDEDITIGDHAFTIGETSKLNSAGLYVKSHDNNSEVTPKQISVKKSDDSSIVKITDNCISISETDEEVNNNIQLTKGTISASDTIITKNGIKIGDTLIDETALKYLLDIIKSCSEDSTSVEATSIEASDIESSGSIKSATLEVTETATINKPTITGGNISDTSLSSPTFKGNMSFDTVSLKAIELESSKVDSTTVDTLTLKVNNTLILPTTPGSENGSVWIGS